MESKYKYVLTSSYSTVTTIKRQKPESIERIKIIFSFYYTFFNLWFIHEIDLKTKDVKNIYIVSSEEDIEKIENEYK